ncbi:oxygenase MpaB family protein [Gordonia rhizosphera]|nr:oxygenase MpaB family protein [Gordonia rhizosphera]
MPTATGICELYLECCRWYSKYGISDRRMPRTRGEFDEYFDDFCATRLEVSPEAQALRDEAVQPRTWLPGKVPTPAIRAMLHERARDLLGVEVSDSDRRALRAFAARAKMGAALRPPQLRLIPSARHNPDD